MKNTLLLMAITYLEINDIIQTTKVNVQTMFALLEMRNFLKNC